MTTYDEICRVVKQLKKKYGTNDPFRICKEKGIIVLFQSLGTAADSIKGFYLECKRIKTITINSDLPLTIQRIIAAHELGHCELHRASGLQTFHEVAMFDESSLMEKEANLFAAELLMDDNDVVEVLNRDTTFFTASAILRVPMELLDFMFRVMKWMGFKLIEAPITASGNFLRDMEVPENADFND